MNAIFARIWGAWILAFILIESAALMIGRPGNTLSEVTWAFLAGGWSRLLLAGGFLMWLVLHILLRGRWG